MPTYQAEGSRARQSGKSQLGRTNPDAPKSDLRAYRAPSSALGAQGLERTQSCSAAGETHGSSFTPRAPPAELGSGAQVAALGARRGTWLSACLPPAPGQRPA